MPSVSRAASPFAPFRHRAFFWLWLGVVCSSIGTWGQTVGAQWLFVNDSNAATIVPLVQTASTLPMMLLALPAGGLADAVGPRGPPGGGAGHSPSGVGRVGGGGAGGGEGPAGVVGR